MLEKLMGKGKKIDEKRLIKWVNKSLEEGNDIKSIEKALTKKYGKNPVADFLKKNYNVDAETKEDKRMDAQVADEKRKKAEIDDLDNEMENLKAEATGKVPEELPEAPIPIPAQQPREVTLQRMSSYDIEIVNLLSSIDQGIRHLIAILGNK